MFYFEILFHLPSACIVFNPRKIVTSYRFNRGFIISSHMSSRYSSLTLMISFCALCPATFVSHVLKKAQKIRTTHSHSGSYIWEAFSLSWLHRLPLAVFAASELYSFLKFNISYNKFKLYNIIFAKCLIRSWTDDLRQIFINYEPFTHVYHQICSN